MGELSRLGRYGIPGRQDNFSPYEYFGSPNRDNLWRNKPGGRRGGTPYNGLYGEALAVGYFFQALGI